MHKELLVLILSNGFYKKIIDLYFISEILLKTDKLRVFRASQGFDIIQKRRGNNGYILDILK